MREERLSSTWKRTAQYNDRTARMKVQRIRARWRFVRHLGRNMGF
jgi:hypothetical protein